MQPSGFPSPDSASLGTLSFTCPDSLIKKVETRAAEKGVSVSEYMVRLLQDVFFKNEEYRQEVKFPIPEVNHPLIQALYRNQGLLQSRIQLYEFFEKEFPEIIEKMRLTAILMRKTDFNENVIQDMVASLIPQPYHPMALQAILDVYQITAQRLDQQISSEISI
jgi:hypothetical protein